MATTEETLERVISQPASVKTATAEVAGQDPLTIIEVDRYLAGKAAKRASSSPFAGLRIGRAKPGGSV